MRSVAPVFKAHLWLFDQSLGDDYNKRVCGLNMAQK